MSGVCGAVGPLAALRAAIDDLMTLDAERNPAGEAVGLVESGPVFTSESGDRADPDENGDEHHDGHGDATDAR